MAESVENSPHPFFGSSDFGDCFAQKKEERDEKLDALMLNFCTDLCKIYETSNKCLNSTEEDEVNVLDSVICGPQAVAIHLPLFFPPGTKDTLTYWKLYAAIAKEMGANDSWLECRHLRDTHVFPILLHFFKKCLVSPRLASDVNLMLIMEDENIGFDGIKNLFWPILMELVDDYHHTEDPSKMQEILQRASDLMYQIHPTPVEELALPLMKKNIFDCGMFHQSMANLFTSVDSKCALKMMPIFLSLCQHEEKNVRLSCVVIFSIVACTVPLEWRKRYFVPIYCKLLEDPDMAISNPAVDGLGFFIVALSDLPLLDLRNSRQMKFALGYDEWCRDKQIAFMPIALFREIGPVISKYFRSQFNFSDAEDSPDGDSASEGDSDEQDDPKEFQPMSNGKIEEQNEYNNFIFWRDPLPNVDFDIRTVLSDGKLLRKIKNKRRLIDVSRNDGQPELNKRKMLNTNDDSTNQPNEYSLDFETLPPPLPESAEEINGIPKVLINHFLEDKNKWDVIARAYNFPAVLLCIGCENWPILKETYEEFFMKGRSMVTKIAASYMHELAFILGREIAERDLVPLFMELFQGKPEIYSSAIPHMIEFIMVLSPSTRWTIIPSLIDLVPSETMNAFLCEESSYLSIADSCQLIWPAALALLKRRDRYQRDEAIKTVAEVLSHVAIDVSHFQTLLAELAEQFAHSSNWIRRQTFALVSTKLISDSILSDELFARDILPHLLDLSWDRIPNVRISVAKTLTRHVILRPYFTDENCAHRDVILNVLKRLQTDKDCDVRFFALPLKKIANRPTSNLRNFILN